MTIATVKNLGHVNPFVIRERKFCHWPRNGVKPINKIKMKGKKNIKQIK